MQANGEGVIGLQKTQSASIQLWRLRLSYQIINESSNIRKRVAKKGQAVRQKGTGEMALALGTPMAHMGPQHRVRQNPGDGEGIRRLLFRRPPQDGSRPERRDVGQLLSPTPPWRSEWRDFLSQAVRDWPVGLCIALFV